MLRGYPFFDKYPYTNFEQLNLDKLMELTGSFDQRLLNVETSVADHSVRISALESGLGALEQRVSECEEGISDLGDDLEALTGRVSANETAIENINGDINDLQDDVDRIDGKNSAQDDEIDALKTRMSDAEDDIEDLSGLASQVQRNSNDIQGLDSRVLTLEGSKVTANPGGSPSVNLNTVRIGSTDYAIPSGSGGGSSVTPNPAGAATDTLDKVDIDGTIYDVPSGVDTSDMIAAEYDPTASYSEGDVVIHEGTLYEATASTTGAWDSSKWIATTCVEIAKAAENTASAIEQMYADLGTAYEDSQASVELYTRSSGMDSIPGVNHILTAGSWIVTLNATFNTHELGSKQRVINIYLVDENDNIIAQFGKYMWGSEAIQGILYENSCSLSAVIDIPYGTTKQIFGKVAVRVNTGSGSYEITTIRLGSVRIKPYAS